MGIVVQKFGGSSVATTEKLKKVCNHITKEFEKGNDVAVVVSAQGKNNGSINNWRKRNYTKPKQKGTWRSCFNWRANYYFKISYDA